MQTVNFIHILIQFLYKVAIVQSWVHLFDLKMSKNKLNSDTIIDSRINLTDLDHIFKFVKEDEKIIRAECLIDNCDLKINADSGGHLKKFNVLRHVKRQHLKQYERVVQNLKNKQSESEKLKQTTINKCFKSSNITINMDIKKFEEGIVEMICLGSAPLKMFNGKGFLKIGGEIAKQLGISLGYDAVRQLVLKYAENLQTEIKAELKGKLLYIKMDAATRGYRNFLAVNVQYFNKNKNKMEIRMLDIVDTENQHGSEYLKTAVKKILLKFEIKQNQVLSICVDNAANMVRAVNTFADPSPDENCEYEEQNEIVFSEENSLYQEWESNPEFILPDWIHESDTEVQLMRCGIHSLQLAIWTGLNSTYAKSYLEKIRRAVTKLRTPLIRTILLKRYGLTQSSDTSTRWGSTYLMISRFLKFKNYCEEAAATGATEFDFSESDWKDVQQLCDLLSKPYAATIHLQSTNLTPGLFFKEWCYLKKFFSEQSGQIALDIVTAMEKRENKILFNTHFLAGVYADPRYRILLTNEQTKLAKNGLFDISVRLHKIAAVDCLRQTEEADCSLISTSSDDDDFEKYLDSQEKRKRILKVQMSNIEHFKNKFDTYCESVEDLGRLKADNVYDAIEHYPEQIKHACKVASSMPTSQASVERLFSSMKIILSDLRQCIKEDLLSAILFYRNNVEN